jgi:hypothetical protein
VPDRTVLAGEAIGLRTRFKDDTGAYTTASGVYVHIFKPGVDTSDLANAFLVSGVPTYLGEGVFEYTYNVPFAGPVGTWQDQWVGNLTTHVISGLFQFEVVAAGQFLSLGNQLKPNNIVTITLASGIAATDGTTLGSETTLSFMTTASPAYTNIRKINLEIGGFIGDIPNEVMQTAIIEASMEADTLSFNIKNTRGYAMERNDSVFNHARREYTTCLASQILLNNMNNMSLRSKTLGDLHVEYDTNGIRDAIRKVDQCRERWIEQIMAGGFAKAAKTPASVVKGEMDPDRPIVARSWQSTDSGGVSRRIPAANTRETSTNSRRYLRTWDNGKPRYKKKWW